MAAKKQRKEHTEFTFNAMLELAYWKWSDQIEA